MKKLLSAMSLVLALSPGGFGAVSQDMAIYVRQDVFEAKMEALRNEIQAGNERILAEIRIVNTKLEEMDKRINTVENHSSNRHEDLKTMIYWGFSILGLFIAFAIFGPSFGEFLRNLRQPSITVEEVKQLISTAIAEAQLSGRPQV